MAGIKSDEKLGRSLGFFPTFAIGTGTMIGAGIFVLPGIAASSAGPASILSFLIGGIISMATALSMAELATGMPRAGGDYYFISRAMGSVFGAVIGLGAWFALVFKGAFALVGLAEYLSVFISVPVLIISITAGVILLVINYRGAESSGVLQNYIVIGLFVILTLFIIRGLFTLEQGNLTPFAPYGTESIFMTTGVIFVSYLGISQLAAISGEVKNPSENLPKAFIASVGVVTLLYMAVMLVITGVLPLEEVIASEAPLVEVANLIGGEIGRIAIVLAGFFATVSTANAAILSSSRYPFAMGRDDLIPEWFVEIHEKFKTPYKAILVTGLTMIALLLLFNVEQLAKLGSTFNVLIFVLINLSVIILRYRTQDWYQPAFRSPFFPVVQIFGILASIMLIPQMGVLPTAFAIAVIIIGILWYNLYASEKTVPQYNLFDVLEDDKVPTRLEDVDYKKVLVPVSNPEHEADLLHLADRLGDKILGLNVIKVPQQTGLKAAKEEHLEKYDQTYRLLKDKFETCLRGKKRDKCIPALSKEQDYLVVFDHYIDGAILEQAENEQMDLIVMGWQDKNRLQYAIGGITNKVLSRAKNHVAILKGEFPETLKQITVAYDGRFNSRYGVYLAKRLAMTTGAKIKLLRVVNPDRNQSVKEDIIADLKELSNEDEGYNIDYEIKERYSVTDTILAETEKTDLTIIGDSTQRFKRSFLGTLPQKVATHTENPILIVKRHRPISKETIQSFFGKIKDRLF